MTALPQFALSSSPLARPSSEKAALLRRSMVESQLRPNRVHDTRLLHVMDTLPREDFVPPHLAPAAYVDEDLPLAPGRGLMQPMVLARMVQEAELTGFEKILEVAPATGYATAVLAKLARAVIAVDSDEILAKAATANLSRLGIANAWVKVGPMAEGWSAEAPYDVVFISGAAQTIPYSLFDQLADGGKLLAVVKTLGVMAHVGEARLYLKANGTVSYRTLFNAHVTTLTDFNAPHRFTL